ncbi:hypothetical protein AKJ16_DCAP16066 [Drosera capensis]
MGGVLNGNNGNGNGGGIGNHKGRPYALMILLAFGAAFSAIMVLHKFRERRVIDMITAEKDQQLIAIHSLLQTSQLLHEKTKKKILHIKEGYRIERKELLSTISAFKEEREKLYMELEEKNSEIKTLREHQANSGKESSQAAALEEILKQKEAEIEHLKNQIETIARVRSVSTDDPSNPSKTHSDVLEQNMDASQSTEDDHSANLTDRREGESTSHEDNNVALETVHLVEKTVSKEEPNPLESVNKPSIREPDAREERNIDENQRKDSTKSQGERDSAVAQEDLTEAQKTSNGAVKAPAFNSQQEGQGIENVQRGELNPERTDSTERISHTRRHRRHRKKILKEYLRNRQLGIPEQTEAAKKQISTDTVESQQNNTVGSVEKSNVIEEHVEESVTKNEARGQVEQLPPSDEQSKITENLSQEGVAEKAQETETISSISSSMKLQETQKLDDKNDAGRQDEQLPESNDQSKETENQNGQSLPEKAHETEQFENITTSMKQQETQKSEKVMDQINTVGTEQKEIPNREQAVVNTEKESVEVSLSINDKKQNFSDESKHIEEEEQQRNQATPESKGSNNKENTIEQVTEREDLEDEEEADNGSSDLDTVTENSSIDSKPKQAEETKEDMEEEETEF